MRFDCYIDDITITAEGSEAVVLASLAAALKDLVNVVEQELHCTVEWSKAAVVASSDTLRKRLQMACGISEESAKTVPNLGVDFTFGKMRRQLGRTTTRYQRMASAKRRKGRLHVLRKVRGPKRATLVGTSGVLSASTYGSAINGVSDSELRSLRRIAASAMTPSARGRSLSALLLLHGDPCWSAAVAPLTQWIRSAWKANEDLELVGRGIDCDFMAAA